MCSLIKNARWIQRAFLLTDLSKVLCVLDGIVHIIGTAFNFRFYIVQLLLCLHQQYYLLLILRYQLRHLYSLTGRLQHF